MAKDSDKPRRGFEREETGGGTLSGLLAEEDEFDRRTLWRLGSWAAASVGAVVVALVTSQSSIGWRREQIASIDLTRQAQQIQLAAKQTQSETRRLASAIDTLNSDRDRLYSRVGVLEQGLDSVTGAIARQTPAPSPPQAKANPANPNQSSASAAAPASSSVPSPQPPLAATPAPIAATAKASAPPVAASSSPAATASIELPAIAAKPAPVAPVVAPVAATAPAVVDKQEKQAAAKPPSEPTPAAKPSAPQQAEAAQPSGSLIASKSMMGPPDPAAGKLIAPASLPKTAMAAPLTEIAAVPPKASEKASEKGSEEAGVESASATPEVAVRRTEFGVDVGGANSVPGLRALWRGLLRSRANSALTSLRPIIVIKESNSGLGMQLRLVAGPINDAAAAAKICASLTVNERGCSTAVYEGQRLAMGAEEQAKADAKTASETKPAAEAKPVSEGKSEGDSRQTSSGRGYTHRHYASRHQPPKEDPPPPPPKEEPSTLSLIFGKH